MDVEAAQEAVERAQLAYRKGGGPDAVNHANRQLADAHWRLYEVAGGAVHDKR